MYMYIRRINSQGEEYDFQVMDAAETTIGYMVELASDVDARGGHIEIEYQEPGR